MASISILLHACDGVGHIPIQTSFSTSISTTISSLKRICIHVSIVSLKDQSILTESTTGPSKSNRLLLFDEKIELCLFESIDIHSYAMRIALVNIPIENQGSSKEYIILASCTQSLVTFLNQYQSIKPHRIDQIFELKDIPNTNLNTSESISKQNSVRLRIGILILSSTIEKSVMDKAKQEFGKVVVKTAYKKDMTIPSNTNMNNQSNTNTNTVTSTSSTGHPMDTIEMLGINIGSATLSAIKQNQSVLIRSLQNLFNGIRKATNTNNQVYGPSNSIIEFIRVISNPTAEYIQKVVDMMIKDFVEPLSTISGDIPENTILLIIQGISKKLSIESNSSNINNSSNNSKGNYPSRSASTVTISTALGGMDKNISGIKLIRNSIGQINPILNQNNAGTEDIILILLNKMKIKRIPIDQSSNNNLNNGLYIRIWFYEDSIKSYIFRLLGRKYESITTSSPMDWQMKIAVMERILASMKNNFDSLGIDYFISTPQSVTTTEPTIDSKDSSIVSPPSIPNEPSKNSMVEVEMSESKKERNSIATVAIKSPEEAMSKFHRIQSSVDRHLSESSTVGSLMKNDNDNNSKNKIGDAVQNTLTNDSVVPKTDDDIVQKTTIKSEEAIHQSISFLSEDINQIQILKESVQQITDKIFDGSSNNSAIAERYQKYVTVIESLRKLERRIHAALRRLQSYTLSNALSKDKDSDIVEINTRSNTNVSNSSHDGPNKQMVPNMDSKIDIHNVSNKDTNIISHVNTQIGSAITSSIRSIGSHVTSHLIPHITTSSNQSASMNTDMKLLDIPMGSLPSPRPPLSVLTSRSRSESMNRSHNNNNSNSSSNYNSPRVQIFILSIIEQLSDAIAICIPQIANQKYRNDMIQLMNRVGRNRKEYIRLNRFIMRISNRLSMQWMSETSKAMDKSFQSYENNQSMIYNSVKIQTTNKDKKSISSDNDRNSIVGVVLDSIVREVICKSDPSLVHIDGYATYRMLSMNLLDGTYMKQKRMPLLSSPMQADDKNNKELNTLFAERDMMFLYGIAMSCPTPPYPSYNDDDSIGIKQSMSNMKNTNIHSQSHSPHNQEAAIDNCYEAILLFKLLNYDPIHVLSAVYIYKQIQSNQGYEDNDTSSNSNNNFSNHKISLSESADMNSSLSNKLQICSPMEYILWINEIYSINPTVLSSNLFLDRIVKEEENNSIAKANKYDFVHRILMKYYDISSPKHIDVPKDNHSYQSVEFNLRMTDDNKYIDEKEDRTWKDHIQQQKDLSSSHSDTRQDINKIGRTLSFMDIVTTENSKKESPDDLNHSVKDFHPIDSHPVDSHPVDSHFVELTSMTSNPLMDSFINQNQDHQDHNINSSNNNLTVNPTLVDSTDYTLSTTISDIPINDKTNSDSHMFATYPPIYATYTHNHANQNNINDSSDVAISSNSTNLFHTSPLPTSQPILSHPTHESTEHTLDQTFGQTIETPTVPSTIQPSVSHPSTVPGLSTSTSSAQLSTAIDLNMLPKLSIGDNVLGLFECIGEWYPATIHAITSNLPETDSKKYFLRYDDGDEGYCSRLMIKRINDKQPKLLLTNQHILAKDSIDDIFYPAMILSYCNGTNPNQYEIKFDKKNNTVKLSREDIIGPHLDRESIERIRTSSNQSSQSALRPVQAKPNDVNSLNVGDKVEGRFGAGNEWYSTKITNIRSSSDYGSLYDILYDDGDKETGISRIKIRKLGQKMSDHLSPHEEVDAPCSLLVYLGIVPSDNNIITGHVVSKATDKTNSKSLTKTQTDSLSDKGGNNNSSEVYYSVEFDLEKLGLRGDVEEKLVGMDEETVQKIADHCDVSEENDGLKVTEVIQRKLIYSIYS